MKVLNNNNINNFILQSFKMLNVISHCGINRRRILYSEMPYQLFPLIEFAF